MKFIGIISDQIEGYRMPIEDNGKIILHVTGMFRSGTTLVARMLNAHPKIILASDPLFEFFKTFRNEIFLQNNIKINDLDRPLDSNFKLQNRIKNEKFEKINFDVDIKFTDLNELTEKIKNRSQPYSPIYSSLLKPFSGKNFRLILESALKTIEKSYHKDNSKVLGFKTVWTEQFASTILNEFNGSSKVIFIIRDPRAVVASNFVKTDRRYPLEFLIRQWRKSVCYAILYSKIIKKFKHNSLIIKYEDLVSRPDQITRKITDFLGVEYDNILMDPSKYKNGNNEPWQQNTSYSHAKNQFNTKSIDKWKDVLDKEIIKFIEFSCYPEIRYLKYNMILEEKLSEEVNYPKDDFSTLAEWVKKYYPKDLINDKNWIQKIEKDEKFRNICFQEGISGKTFDTQVIEDYFIDSRYFSHIINYERSL